jgi:hypothetical protein
MLRMLVFRFVRLRLFWVCGGGVVYVWPCSVAAYWGVCRGENGVRGYLPVHHITRASVNYVVEGISSVGFDFSYVTCEAFVVSCFDDVVGVAVEVFVYVVCISKGVECIYSYEVCYC